MLKRLWLRRILAKIIMKGPDEWDISPEMQRRIEWDRLMRP